MKRGFADKDRTSSCLDVGPRWGQFQRPAGGKACCWESRVKSGGGDTSCPSEMPSQGPSAPRGCSALSPPGALPRWPASLSLFLRASQPVHTRRALQCTPAPSGKDRHPHHELPRSPRLTPLVSRIKQVAVAAWRSTSLSQTSAPPSARSAVTLLCRSFFSLL